MTNRVNVLENMDRFEVYSDKTLDQQRIDPNLIVEQIKNQMKFYLRDVLEEVAEHDALVQIAAEHYQRTPGVRVDYRNGYRTRSLGTSLGTIDMRLPRARNISLEFSFIERYQRRWAEVDEILLEAHIGGLSCRDAGERLGDLLGCKVSGTTVAGLKKTLSDRLRGFKNAPLKDEYKAIIVDGMFARIKQCGKQKRPLIVVIGIKEDGSDVLLGMKVCYSENSTEVAGLLRNIKERGVRGVNLDVVTIDGDKGLESGVLEVYGNARIQDCIFHRINRLHKNAKSKKRARCMMKDASEVFAAENKRDRNKRLEAFVGKWKKKEPDAVRLFEKDLYRCYEVNVLPAKLRSKASTTGRCEGLFKLLRGRLDQIGAFENPHSLELYAYGIICQKKMVNIPGRSIGDPLLAEFTHSD